MHPQAANAYADLKRRRARQFNNDIQAYGDGKDASIKQHEALALAWEAAQAGLP